MQFDVTGFLIFLAFILPGFVAQKARFSLAPRSLKPLSPVGEVGEFVLASVWVHSLLAVAIRMYFPSLQGSISPFLRALSTTGLFPNSCGAIEFLFSAISSFPY